MNTFIYEDFKTRLNTAPKISRSCPIKSAVLCR